MEETKQHIKIADVVLIILCLLTAFILAGCLLLGREKGRLLQISYNGEIILTVQLEDSISGKTESAGTSENGVYYLITYGKDGAVPVRYEELPDISADGSYNLVYLSGGEVKMVSADCRDQICVHHKPVTSGGESIICLPHRLAVEITGGEQDEMTDGMVK